MRETLKRKLDKKGFTLAELLIVVAIIAVMMAIAIPVFAQQLDKAKEAVDRANLSAAANMASADYQLSNPTSTGDWTYTADATPATGETKITNLTIKLLKQDTTVITTDPGTLASAKTPAQRIEVVITTNGQVKSANWK